MIKTYKFRLFTNANQERELSICLETHRRLYNQMLEAKQFIWEQYHVDFNYFEQSAWLKHERSKNRFYANLNYGSAQQTLKRLKKSFDRFFKAAKSGRRSGYPRFKSVDQFDSFSYAMTGNGGGIKIVNGKLRLQNIGTIRVRWHREIPAIAKFKEARIVRQNRKWFVCFCVELPGPVPTANSKAVGIDVGIASFATTSDNEFLGDSKILEKKLSELRRRQRALSRCRKGSSRRLKVKNRVSTLHAKVANSRRDMQHKVARYLVDRYGIIAVESLNIQGMVRNNRLARYISDAAWSQFVGILTYKAENAGGQVISVNPRNTSRTCSVCGHCDAENRKTQSSFKCIECGHIENADVNAAKNILAGALPRIAKPKIALV